MALTHQQLLQQVHDHHRKAHHARRRSAQETARAIVKAANRLGRPVDPPGPTDGQNASHDVSDAG